MAKLEEKQKAVDLRKQGLSYREILQHVPVAKSTLSLWLRTVGLSRPQRQRLTVRKLEAARRGWQKVRADRLKRTRRITEEALVEAARWVGEGDPLWLIGTILYWAEGTKAKEWGKAGMGSLTTMDPGGILVVA